MERYPISDDSRLDTAYNTGGLHVRREALL